MQMRTAGWPTGHGESTPTPAFSSALGVFIAPNADENGSPRLPATSRPPPKGRRRRSEDRPDGATQGAPQSQAAAVTRGAEPTALLPLPPPSPAMRPRHGPP